MSLQRLLDEKLPAIPSRKRVATSQTRSSTLVIRRKNKKDKAPFEKIKIRTRRDNGQIAWVKRGSLEPGENMTLLLEEGRYQVQARIKNGCSKDKDTITLEIKGEMTARLVTYGEVALSSAMLVYLETDG